LRDLLTAALAAMAVLGPGAGAAQAGPAPAALRPLCPDRPGKATAPCTVDEGHWQLEIDAADYTRQASAGGAAETWVLAGPQLKYGVTDALDLEASLAPFTRVRPGPGAGGRGASGIGDLYLRAKLNLAGNAGGALGLAIEPYVKAPTAREGIGDGAWEGGLLVPVSVSLPHGWSLGVTPEADLLRDGAGHGRHLALQLPVGLGHAVGPLAGSVELWTQQEFDPAGAVRQYSVDLAAAWTPAGQPELQLDAGANLGLNASTPDLQVYVGASRRF